MGSLHISKFMHHCVLCTTAVAFISSSVCSPLLAYAYDEVNMGVNLNDIVFFARLEKLYEKAKRYADKLEKGKLIEVMFDIKMEVERYTGKKIDLEGRINAIEKEAKRNGAQFKKDEISQIKKELKKAGKKHSHKALFLYECNLHDLEFDQEACDLHFEDAFIAKHGKPKEEEDAKVEVPIRVSIGITASLCGYFLSFIPHPLAQTASKFLMATGIGLCVDGTINRMEEDENKKKQNS